MTSPNSGEDRSRLADPVYALGSDVDERERLRRQAVELRAISAAVLDRVGLRPGQSAIDLGCGPRGVGLGSQAGDLSGSLRYEIK